MIRQIEISPFHRVLWSFFRGGFQTRCVGGRSLARMVPSYIVECPGGRPGLTAQLVHHCCQDVPDYCTIVNWVLVPYPGLTAQQLHYMLSRCTRCTIFEWVLVKSVPWVNCSPSAPLLLCLTNGNMPDNPLLVWGKLHILCTIVASVPTLSNVNPKWWL